MTAILIVLAVTAVLALSALALAALALFHARTFAAASARRAEATWSESDSRVDILRKEVAALTSDVRELQTQPGPGPAALKAGLNLSRRSQALRMHRRGESAAEIARALDLPQQEIELLIKVQRIVLGSLSGPA